MRRGRKKLHLVVNGRFLTRKLTGVDRTALEITRRLIRLSGTAFDVTVVAPKAEFDRSALPEESLVTWGHLKGHLWEQFELPFYRRDGVLINLANTGPLLRKNQIIMVHDAQTFTHPESYGWLFSRLYRAVLPVLARRARKVVTVSQYSRSQLCNFLAIDERRISVIPNGSDHLSTNREDHFVLERLGLPFGGYFLLFSSSYPHKNMRFLLRAYLGIPKPMRLPIAVVGQIGDDIWPEHSVMSDQGVNVLGRVSDNDLGPLYKGARALLLPSLTEGFGLPALEAMSFGCPVIASNGGALPEVCGGLAVNIDPCDETSWQSTMKAAFHDEAYHLTRRDARKQHASRFTWDAAAQGLLDVASAEFL